MVLFFFYHLLKMADTFGIGATRAQVTFPDLIINNVSLVADGAQQGFENIVHNPRQLIQETVDFSAIQIPSKLADAVSLRNKYTKIIAEKFNFPFCSTLINSVPTPWTLFETAIDTESDMKYTYNFSRIPDFIGKNYLHFELPKVDLPSTLPPTIQDLNNPNVQIPKNRFLGAWHNDLIPRIIKEVIIKNKQASYDLYTYTGYDIWMYNLFFNQHQQNMSDVLCGQDNFELVYDPFDFSNIINPYYQYNNRVILNGVSVTDEYYYINGKYYENPVMRNTVKVGHSIHERRAVHEAYVISVPMDILPFGSTMMTSVPTAALATECGYITFTFYNDWFNRAFYLVNTAVTGKSVVSAPSAEYTTYSGSYEVYNSILPTNVAPIGIGTTINTTTKADQLGAVSLTGLSLLAKAAPSEAAGGTSGLNLPIQLDNTYVGLSMSPYNMQSIKVDNIFEAPELGGNINVPRAASMTASNIAIHESIDTINNVMLDTGRATPPNPMSVTSNMVSARVNEYNPIPPIVDTVWNMNWYLYSPSNIRSNESQSSFESLYAKKFRISLLQTGYTLLTQIKNVLTKFPVIFINTTWNTQIFDVAALGNKVNISNDSYIQAIAFVFIPIEKNIEFLRVYPHQLSKPELPMLHRLVLQTDNNQGETICDWPMLNKIIPFQAGMDCLPQNVGLFTFAPTLEKNNFPLAFYDTNFYGEIKLQFKVDTATPSPYSYIDANGQAQSRLVNLKQGNVYITSIGINGLVILNLQFNRLIF